MISTEAISNLTRIKAITKAEALAAMKGMYHQLQKRANIEYYQEPQVRGSQQLGVAPDEGV